MFGTSLRDYREMRDIEARAREVRSRAERRDRFAMAALTGLLATPDRLSSIGAKELARLAYKVADAMEAEREKGPEQ